MSDYCVGSATGKFVTCSLGAIAASTRLVVLSPPVVDTPLMFKTLCVATLSKTTQKSFRDSNEELDCQIATYSLYSGRCHSYMLRAVWSTPRRSYCTRFWMPAARKTVLKPVLSTIALHARDRNAHPLQLLKIGRRRSAIKYNHTTCFQSDNRAM